MKPIARYKILFGLSGCYLADSEYGVFEVTTRKELSSLIRNSLEFYEMPKYLFSQVKIRKLWSFIKRNGSSSAHFNLHHKQFVINFYGLTEEEYLYEELKEDF